MKKLISLLVIVGVVGGLGPFAALAFAAERAPATGSASASASCPTLPELSGVRQDIAQRALETDNPVQTYRIAVYPVQRAKTVTALAAQPHNCVAGLRTALLTGVGGRTLIRLADCCDTTVGGPGDLGAILGKDFGYGGDPGPTTTYNFDINVPSTGTVAGIAIATAAPSLSTNPQVQGYIAGAGALIASMSPGVTSLHVSITVGADGSVQHVEVSSGGGGSSAGSREGPQGGGGGG